MKLNFVKPHKIITYSAYSDNCYFHFFYQLSDWGFTKFFFRQILKVSAFYLEKQKSFTPKKNSFKPLSISKQKRFAYQPKFQWRLWHAPSEIILPYCGMIVQGFRLKHVTRSAISETIFRSICTAFFILRLLKVS